MMDVLSWMDTKRKNQRDNESGGNLSQGPGKDVELAHGHVM